MSEAFTITDEQQDYSQYDLNANPFPYSPVPAEDPEIYCGQQHVSDKISSTVSSMLSTGKSKHLVVRLFHFGMAVLLYNMWLLVDFLVQVAVYNEFRSKQRVTAQRFLEMLDQRLSTLLG